MPSSNSVGTLDLPLPSVPASLCAFALSGLRKILVTRTFEDDGDPVFRAAVLSHKPGPAGCPGGFVGSAAMALATSGHRVLIVQAGASRTDPPSRRGLWELLHATYLCELSAERTAQFGLGDWLEILDAQGLTGDLHLEDGGDHMILRIVQGSIHAISCPTSGAEDRLPEAAIRTSISERIAHMLTARPAMTFVPSASALAQATHEGAKSCLDELFRGPLSRRLGHPFLTKQIAEHLVDTALPNLKLLTAGAGVLTRAFRRPLGHLLNRLGATFGIVLIDAPPVSSAGPTATLAGLAYAALVVASLAGVRSVGLLRTIDELRRAGVTMVAVHAVRTGASLPTARAS